ncbi:ABC transporter ATP-binding protein [Streptomyces sp. KLOTTS4A1]|uniref:ABC transporter ATP-binding protein n=1 Tax=Streptomyces sp. KLOTTS4A1 TaxID=3390996 RepID=UPI0039F4B2DA
MTTQPPPLITARGIEKAYGRTQALRGASVSLAAGEILAVTGASGSGKSTLLHCLAGIVTPDAGSVQYAGTELGQLSEARRTELRRTGFGILFQFGQLIPELSALDNVALPLLLAGTRRADAQEQAADWLGRFGVYGQAGLRPGAMSGGQAQRVSLARALVTGPEVIFADEPTGALDTLTGEQVMTTLVQSARASGCAVLLITHDSQVAAYADREVMLSDGLVKTDGPWAAQQYGTAEVGSDG